MAQIQLLIPAFLFIFLSKSFLVFLVLVLCDSTLMCLGLGNFFCCCYFQAFLKPNNQLIEKIISRLKEKCGIL